MGGVLLIVMPFCGADRPQIGVSTLKAQLMRDGIPCDVAYFNIPFAAAAGYDAYDWITNNYSYEVFAGEWIFSPSLFTPSALNRDGYVRDVLQRHGAFPADKLRRIARMAGLVEPFLDYCLRSIDWRRYDVVGFTSTFEQNLASLALAARIKRAFPDKTIVMGGGNCGGAMGLQLHESFPFLDYVFTGESDVSFPRLVREVLNGGSDCGAGSGYVYRDGRASVDTGTVPLLHDLDVLPYPNFDDYFRQLSAMGLDRVVSPFLQIETARGCWWGAKHHCTFCGLNRDEMAFRLKSPERAFDEIVHLVETYGPRFVSSVDNIIGMQYFTTLLPKLRERDLGIRLFYETKANLRRDQVKLLGEAGVTTIQPGIESFSDHVLQLMRKGVSALQNVQLLKWCQRYGVEPRWNLLYGFPGERDEDYAEVLRVCESIGHLPAPLGFGSLRLDRFSPYFDAPEEFGIRNVKALKPYQYLYPLDEPVRNNLAYFFDYEFDGKERKNGQFKPIIDEIERWKSAQPWSRLDVAGRDQGGMAVRDTRRNRSYQMYRFPAVEASIVDFCDSVRRLADIVAHVQRIHGDATWTEARVRDFLEYLVQHRLMLRTGDRYLSVILPDPSAVEDETEASIPVLS